MQILTVDVGTGTQDIFLFDARLNIENGFKLIVPSPTMIVYRRIRAATRRGEAILLTGVTMGGGPSHWATEDHIRAGLPVYATPDAARSFNDDLDEVQSMGIRVVSEDEAASLPDSVTRLGLKDFDFQAIAQAFGGFGVLLQNLAILAIAVFDHGAAPPNYSDRKFRFEYLDRRVREANRLSAFAYRAEDVPDIMTRMQAVAHSAREVDAPLMVMDTAPAAVLGATLDPRVRARDRLLVANIGNFHTLAFRLGADDIEGVFEHHTGFMNRAKMESLLHGFAGGTLTNEFVFDDKGHGALVYRPTPLIFPEDDFGVVVTGPRQSMMQGSHLKPHFAAPFGDMMLAGCFGMLAAATDLFPDLSQPIRDILYQPEKSGAPPWEVQM
ncbi:MAG: DUF1786 domain-containing protein [Anaerolineales bacterium]